VPPLQKNKNRRKVPRKKEPRRNAATKASLLCFAAKATGAQRKVKGRGRRLPPGEKRLAVKRRKM
jgi:hypothetical protein